MTKNHFQSLCKLNVPYKCYYQDAASGDIFKETQNMDSKECKHPYVHCSVIDNSQDLEAIPGPTGRWVVQKLWHIYPMEYYSALNTKEILPFGTACNIDS